MQNSKKKILIEFRTAFSFLKDLRSRCKISVNKSCGLSLYVIFVYLCIQFNQYYLHLHVLMQVHKPQKMKMNEIIAKIWKFGLYATPAERLKIGGKNQGQKLEELMAPLAPRLHLPYRLVRCFLIYQHSLVLHLKVQEISYYAQ